MNKQKRQDIFLLYGVIACVVLLFVVGMFSKKHLDVSDYIDVEFTGADGYASAKCDVDKEAVYNELSRGVKNMEKLTAYRELADSLNAAIEQIDISNGDKVKVNVSYDAETAKTAGIKITNSYTLRAANINEGQKIDLFEKVEVVFAGISPEAYVVIRNNWEDEKLKELVFVADKSEGIVTGDDIAITCAEDVTTLARKGYLVDGVSHVYKADKLSSYVEDVKNVDTEIVKQIDEQTAKAVVDLAKDPTFRILYKATGDEAYLRTLNDEVAQNIELENKVFLKRKDATLDVADNYMYWIYSADIVTSDTTQKVYFAFEYSQAYLTVDGTFDIARENVAERYTCSTDYDDIYNTTIGQKSDNYNIENL